MTKTYAEIIKSDRPERTRHPVGINFPTETERINYYNMKDELKRKTGLKHDSAIIAMAFKALEERIKKADGGK